MVLELKVYKNHTHFYKNKTLVDWGDFSNGSDVSGIYPIHNKTVSEQLGLLLEHVTEFEQVHDYCKSWLYWLVQCDTEEGISLSHPPGRVRLRLIALRSEYPMSFERDRHVKKSIEMQQK